MQRQRISGYGLGDVSNVIAADDVLRQAAKLPGVARARLAELAGPEPLLTVEQLVAGYGNMEILHSIDLQIGSGQALCLIGPNGAGKSTVLHALYGFADIVSGRICLAGRDIARMPAKDKLAHAGIAYVLQDSSIFPDMTVAENLWLGGYLLPSPAAARTAADEIFERYPTLADRRNQAARVLSGGERRLLEIARALVMNPQIVLIDEPSIGLEPRYIDEVFEILNGLRQELGKTLILVEQNAKKGLEFADIGYVLVSGRIALASPGHELLADREVERLFLGG